MAKLILDYYSGNDEYTDGDIENEMLRIAKEEINIEDDIKNGGFKFPILYHFSHIRENILNWYPFKSNANILEIGSGCGALTGLLCEKANRVTSIELSKLRATINYYRHKDYDNLDIVVGNFNDIVLHDKFDYVVLNGVFEYAISFTKCENPYVQFLNFVLGFLNDEGKILIAIENRMGLKYFAGASEDHTGNIFLGLNEYRNNNSVRTFSKGELTDILNESNLKYYKFFYPYPDYKFPNEIFTDETINSGSYGKYYYSLDQSRLRIFEETKIAKSLQKENVMDVFSNSFLVEACKKSAVSNDIIYAKLNNDRHRKFRIATVVQDDGQKRKVFKKALNDDAIEHIISMKKKADIYNGGDYFSLQGDSCGDKLIYPFIYEKSVDTMISNLIVEGNAEEIVSILKGIYNTFFISPQMSEDYHSSQFTEVFGVERYIGTLPCIKPANIDLICDNIYYVDKKYVVIDCEWVFEFDIPCQFIIWRTINELYNKHTKLQELISESFILEQFFIDEGLSSVFREWANYFAREYVGSFRVEKSSKQDILINMDDIYHQLLHGKKLISKVYYNQGRGFNEEDIIISNVEIKDDNFFEIEYSFELINNILELRWDPVELKPCKCIVSSIESNVDLKMWPINAFENDEVNSTFITLDPQYLIEGNISQIKYMKISGKIVFLDIKDIVTEFNIINDNNTLDKNKCEQLQIEINSNNNQIKILSNLIEQKENNLKEMEEILKAELNSKDELLTELQLIKQETINSNNKLAAIYNSKSWKLLCKLSIFKGTIMKLKNISKKRANDE